MTENVSLFWPATVLFGKRSLVPVEFTTKTLTDQPGTDFITFSQASVAQLRLTVWRGWNIWLLFVLISIFRHVYWCLIEVKLVMVKLRTVSCASYVWFFQDQSVPVLHGVMQCLWQAGLMLYATVNSLVFDIAACAFFSWVSACDVLVDNIDPYLIFIYKDSTILNEACQQTWTSPIKTAVRLMKRFRLFVADHRDTHCIFSFFSVPMSGRNFPEGALMCACTWRAVDTARDVLTHRNVLSSAVYSFSVSSRSQLLIFSFYLASLCLSRSILFLFHLSGCFIIDNYIT